MGMVIGFVAKNAKSSFGVALMIAHIAEQGEQKEMMFDGWRMWKQSGESIGKHE